MACCSKGPLAQVNKDTIKAGVPALALPQFRQDTSSCAFSVLVSVSPVLLSLVNFYELSQALSPTPPRLVLAIAPVMLTPTARQLQKRGQEYLPRRLGIHVHFMNLRTRGPDESKHPQLHHKSASAPEPAHDSAEVAFMLSCNGTHQ